MVFTNYKNCRDYGVKNVNFIISFNFIVTNYFFTKYFIMYKIPQNPNLKANVNFKCKN